MDARNSKQSRKAEWFGLATVARLRSSTRVIRIFIDFYTGRSSSFEGFACIVLKERSAVLLYACGAPIEKSWGLVNVTEALKFRWLHGRDGACITLHLSFDCRCHVFLNERGPSGRYLLTSWTLPQQISSNGFPLTDGQSIDLDLADYAFNRS